MDASKTYETPTLSVVGSFESLTQGLSNGNSLDQAFPNDTPKPQLTFS
jgi:hypothetical protein